MRLTRGRIEKMQQNYVWYAHPPKNMQKMLWEEKSKKKIKEKYIAFFFAIAQLKTEVGKCKLRLAEMRWEIDVAELCQK